MPSNERVTAALAALKPQISVFRFFLASTLERARKTLASDSRDGQHAAALGEFAGGRIDPARFAMISSGPGPLDVLAGAVIQRVVEALERLLGAGDEQFVVHVRPGASAAEAVRARLETVGAAFGAAALVELVRRREYDPLQHGLSFDGYNFERWTAAERKLVPALVVCLEGRDLDAFELAPLLDGCVRLALLVNDVCAPAPLARLISPGVFVAQSDDVNVLERVSDFAGPAVIALLQGDEARFVHDPRTGSALWQRIEVTRMPEALPRKSIGARSAWQQRDDLAHLKSLAEQPAYSANSADALVQAIGGSSTDAAERLTSWLIDHTGPANPS